MKYWTPNTNIVEADIKGFMGMKVTFHSIGGNIYQGVVAGVDPYIGISVVREEDHKIALHCLHGPMDPQFRESYLRNNSLKEKYNNRFPIFLKYLKEAKEIGIFDEVAMVEEMDIPLGLGNGASCPFGL